MEITKKKFDEAYNQYLPKGWIRFAFKYFSKSTEKKDMAPSNTIGIMLGVLFLSGMVGTIMKWPRPIIAAATYIYIGILVLLVGFLFAAVQANNSRLRKVMRKLDISKQTYNELVEKYYRELS